MKTTTIGTRGEDLALDFLKNQGYKILERNFRIRGGEIDIVAIENQTLVYVEVKTRSSRTFGYPQESVTPQKIKFLERAAKFYRNNRQYLKLPSLERIDVVAVDLADPSTPSLKLIKNAGF